MSKFKVGDRVERTLNPVNENIQVGDISEITEIHDNKISLKDFTPLQDCCYVRDNFELVKYTTWKERYETKE